MNEGNSLVSNLVPNATGAGTGTRVFIAGLKKQYLRGVTPPGPAWKQSLGGVQVVIGRVAF